MKILSKIPRPVYVAGVTILIVLFGATTYIIGTKSVDEPKASKVLEECSYTFEELDKILVKFGEIQNLGLDRRFDSPDIYFERSQNEVSDLHDSTVVTPDGSTTIDKVAIDKLEGECVDVALMKAYNLGARELRDFTPCWRECLVTMDLRYNRLNFSVDNGRMHDVSIG